MFSRPNSRAHRCDELDYVMRPDGVLEPVYGESPDDDAFGDGTDVTAEMESQPESLPPDESLQETLRRPHIWPSRTEGVAYTAR